AIPDYLVNFFDHHFPQINAAVNEKYLKSFELIAQYEEMLAARLLDYLNSIEDIRIIGQRSADAKLRVPTISFVHKTLQSQDIVTAVDKENIGIRYGDFYAKKLIHDLDLEKQGGVVRVSLVHYNTSEEVEKLIAALKKIF